MKKIGKEFFIDYKTREDSNFAGSFNKEKLADALAELTIKLKQEGII